MSAAPVTERGRRTRDRLLEAARAVFEERGFLETRVSDIAERANVATGTFYTYFDSKDAIFVALVDAFIAALYEQSHVGEVAGPDPRQRIHTSNARFVEAFRRHGNLYGVIVQAASFNDEVRRRRLASRSVFIERATRGLRQLQAQGVADPTLDADVTAALLCGMVENFVERSHDLGLPFDDEAAVDAMTEIWARAIGLAP